MIDCQNLNFNLFYEKKKVIYMMKLGDLDMLKDLINSFEETLYYQSMLAVRYDRVHIDDEGVKKLRDFCKSEGLLAFSIQPTI